MKSNIIKYIFIIIVAIIIGFAIYKGYKEKYIGISNQTGNIEEKNQIVTNMRIGIVDFDSINPIISQNKNIINLSTIIYEPLIGISEDYKAQLRLAKECSKINETTYIVKLREDIKWDNNTAITSTDVIYTIEKLKEGKSTYSDNIKNIKSVDEIDDSTIKINLIKEETFFEYNLIFPIVSSNQFINEKNFFESKIIPLSSGMYKIKTITQDYVELVQNNNWYKGNEVTSKINNIKVSFYKNVGEIYNNFKTGNIDIMYTENLKVDDYIGKIGYNTKDCEGRELDFISLNCDNDILSNTEVRQAINFAIDKNEINSLIYNNEYYISEFPIDYGNYALTEEEKISYNLNEAKTTLEKAGWVYQNEEWSKLEKGQVKTIKLNCIVNAENLKRVEVAQLIAKQLQNIGIKVSLNKVSNSSYKEYIKNKNYDMIITGIYNGYSPDLSYFMGKDNIANYRNTEIDKILNELNINNSEENVKEKYRKIIEIYKKDIPYICLYRDKVKVIYSTKLQGNIKPNNYTSYYNLEKWYRL